MYNMYNMYNNIVFDNKRIMEMLTILALVGYTEISSSTVEQIVVLFCSLKELACKATIFIVFCFNLPISYHYDLEFLYNTNLVSI